MSSLYIMNSIKKNLFNELKLPRVSGNFVSHISLSWGHLPPRRAELLAPPD